MEWEYYRIPVKPYSTRRLVHVEQRRVIVAILE